jgi:hypothetical protein
MTLLTSTCTSGDQPQDNSDARESSNRVLEIDECAGVQSEQPDFTGNRGPVNQDERVRLAPVTMLQFVRQHYISRRIFRKFY